MLIVPEYDYTLIVDLGKFKIVAWNKNNELDWDNLFRGLGGPSYPPFDSHTTLPTHGTSWDFNPALHLLHLDLPPIATHIKCHVLDNVGRVYGRREV